MTRSAFTAKIAFFDVFLAFFNKNYFFGGLTCFSTSSHIQHMFGNASRYLLKFFWKKKLGSDFVFSWFLDFGVL